MFNLKHNLPRWERALRIMLGLSVVCAAFLSTSSGLIVGFAAAGGLGVALTGLVGFCPACALAGRKPKEKQS